MYGIVLNAGDGMNHTDLIEQMDEVVYVSDPETYELKFVNKAGLREIHCGPDYAGKKCYRVLQGLEAPCPFCTNHLLTTGGFYIWEHTNEMLGRHYLIKDKLIPWQGKLARMEVAVDITQKESTSRAVAEKLAIEQTLVECTHSLTVATDLRESVRFVLEKLGQFYHSDRCYIFETSVGKVFSNTYEWCAPNVAPQQQALQNIEAGVLARWLAVFRQGQNVVIEDLEAVRQISPAEYDVLRQQDIHSLIVAPLLVEREVIGFLGLDNPAHIESDLSLLESLAYFVSSVLEKDRIQNKLFRLSNYDDLSNTYNRSRYYEYTTNVLGQPLHSLGVLYVDINGLKGLNEQYGQEFGDHALVETARDLLATFPSAAVFRTGDDEFSVLCADMEKVDFDAKCHRVRSLFARREGYTISMGASWESGSKVERALPMANEALLQAKETYYEDGTGPKAARQQLLRRELLTAIRQGQFQVYLQPKVGVEDGRLAGCEALVRRFHPKLGMVMPGQFINLLENDKSIRYLDYYMFESVCRLLARWKEAGYAPLPVSVNFSRLTILDPVFFEQLDSIRRKYGVPGELLEIEITESTDTMGVEDLKAMVQRIRQLGFRVSLDDFGSRYTNLSLLAQVEMDFIKLDKSLIDHLQDNDKNRRLVGVVIEYCHYLGVRLVAEGVEQEAQRQLLQQMHCDYIQGYLAAKPMPVDKYEEKYYK